MKIRKWTFIFVHFSKIQNRFEKTLHHSFFTRPPSPFRGTLPLCSYFSYMTYSHPHHYAADCIFAKNSQKMVQKLGMQFWGILGWPFSGMFWKNVWGDLFSFSKRWSKSWGCSFGEFLVGHFRVIF